MKIIMLVITLAALAACAKPSCPSVDAVLECVGIAIPECAEFDFNANGVVDLEDANTARSCGR